MPHQSTSTPRHTLSQHHASTPPLHTHTSHHIIITHYARMMTSLSSQQSVHAPMATCFSLHTAMICSLAAGVSSGRGAADNNPRSPSIAVVSVCSSCAARMACRAAERAEGNHEAGAGAVGGLGHMARSVQDSCRTQVGKHSRSLLLSPSRLSSMKRHRKAQQLHDHYDEDFP